VATVVGKPDTRTRRDDDIIPRGGRLVAGRSDVVGGDSLTMGRRGSIGNSPVVRHHREPVGDGLPGGQREGPERSRRRGWDGGFLGRGQ
jgi:hypothetical protein